MISLKLNEEAVQAEIKRLQEAGVEITPDIFPGIKLIPKPEIEGPEPSLN